MQRFTRVRGVATPKILLSLPAAGFAMVVAACGAIASGGYLGTSSSAAGGAYGSTTMSSAAASPAASVVVATTSLGQILTDARGRTLYLFTKDSGNSSSCTGACLTVWPAFTATGVVQAGGGVSQGLLGATAGSSGGQVQVTYNGHPLYYYVGDNKPGDTNGQNLDQYGGSWYVIDPAGTQVGG